MITNIQAYAGPANAFPSHSIFDMAVESGLATRVIITDDDGESFGWQFVDQAAADRWRVPGVERVAYAGLRTASTARQAALAAINDADSAANAKLNAARATVRAQVNRIKNIQPPSLRNDQDKMLLALAYTLFKEE